jgi:hypothetical protein
MRVKSILRPYSETSGAVALLASNSKFRSIEGEPDVSPLSEHVPQGTVDDPATLIFGQTSSSLTETCSSVWFIITASVSKEYDLIFVSCKPHKLCHILEVGYLSLFPHWNQRYVDCLIATVHIVTCLMYISGNGVTESFVDSKRF